MSRLTATPPSALATAQGSQCSPPCDVAAGKYSACTCACCCRSIHTHPLRMMLQAILNMPAVLLQNVAIQLLKTEKLPPHEPRLMLLCKVNCASSRALVSGCTHEMMHHDPQNNDANDALAGIKCLAYAAGVANAATAPHFSNDVCQQIISGAPKHVKYSSHPRAHWCCASAFKPQRSLPKPATSLQLRPMPQSVACPLFGTRHMERYMPACGYKGAGSCTPIPDMDNMMHPGIKHMHAPRMVTSSGACRARQGARLLGHQTAHTCFTAPEGRCCLRLQAHAPPL